MVPTEAVGQRSKALASLPKRLRFPPPLPPGPPTKNPKDSLEGRRSGVPNATGPLRW